MPSTEAHATGQRRPLPLVLLPGTLCDARLFAPLQQRLPGITTQVITSTGAHTLEQAAEQVLAQAPAHFALLGYSLGGMVAMEAALHAPERVRGLCLLSTTPLPVPPQHHGPRREAITLAHQLGPAAFLRQHLWPTYTHTPANTIHLPLLEAMATTLGPEVFDRQTEMALARTDFRPRLHALRCATYVLAGAEDRLCPPEAQHALTAALPSGALTLLRDTGHLALLEQPDEVASHVAAWFHLMQAQPKEIE